MIHLWEETQEQGKRIESQNEAITTIKKNTETIFIKLDDIKKDVGMVSSRVTVLETKNGVRSEGRIEGRLKRSAKAYELYLGFIILGLILGVLNFLK